MKMKKTANGMAMGGTGNGESGWRGDRAGDRGHGGAKRKAGWLAD